MDLLVLSLKGLHRQPLRSFLTVVGIIVAVAAIFILISLTQGLKTTVERELAKMGTNRILIIPGAVLGANLGGDVLTESDLKAVKSIPGVKYVLGLQREVLTVDVGEEERSIIVTGVDPKTFEKAFQSLIGGYIEEGRTLERMDKGRHVALLGYSVAHDLFEKNVHPGNVIYIEGKPFRVVGTMKRTFSPLDQFIYVPSDAFYEVTGKKGIYVRIMVQVSEGVNVEEVMDRIERRLKALHRGVKDFNVLTSEQAFQRATRIINLVSAFLVVIASISLVVGALGVMNTMYMSVTERTREIGVMKAVGATKGQIMAVFLLEAGLIGMIGGVVGEILGGGAVLLAQGIIRTFLESYSAYLGVDLLAGLAFFSLLVGIVSGYLPARSAANLDPVEALRR